MKVLIADDHALMREGLQIVLSRFADDLQLFEANNHLQVQQVIDEQKDLDLVLLDLNMPGKEPFESLEQVLTAIPDVRVIVISASEDPVDMRRSINMGAKGFIPKSVNNDVLLAALKLVLSGGTYIPTQLFDYTNVERNSHDKNNPSSVQDAQIRESITRRQKEVLNLLAQGNANKNISRTLCLSEGTIRSHLNTIFKLLDVTNRTQAGVRARELGLLDKA